MVAEGILNATGGVMAQFGVASLARLSKAHPLIVRVLNDAIETFDFSIICSYRDKLAQEQAFTEGRTKAHYGSSPHNFSPACAVDCAPFPLDWNDKEAFHKMASAILASAKKVNVSIRWGADWNMNNRTDDEKFVDSPHFELHPWRYYIAIG